jgi:hypothetical protein
MIDAINEEYIPYEGDGYTFYDRDHNEVITGTVMRVMWREDADRLEYVDITVENAYESLTRTFLVN